MVPKNIEAVSGIEPPQQDVGALRWACRGCEEGFHGVGGRAVSVIEARLMGVEEAVGDVPGVYDPVYDTRTAELLIESRQPRRVEDIPQVVVDEDDVHICLRATYGCSHGKVEPHFIQKLVVVGKALTQPVFIQEVPEPVAVKTPRYLQGVQTIEGVDAVFPDIDLKLPLVGYLHRNYRPSTDGTGIPSLLLAVGSDGVACRHKTRNGLIGVDGQHVAYGFYARYNLPDLEEGEGGPCVYVGNVGVPDFISAR